MKILLVSLNRETEPFTAAPLGMALVSAALEADGHEVRQLDLLFEERPEKTLGDAIKGFGPELIGLSLRNIESSTEFLMPSYRDTVRFIKGVTNAPIMVGGPGFSVMPEQVLKYLGVEYGIKGEGELAVRRLALAAGKGLDPSGIPGVCTFRAGSFSLAPSEPLAAHEMLAGGSWHGLRAGGYDMVGVQSKRGCSFTCAYCTYPALEGRRMRLRPPSAVAREMELLSKEHGVEAFYFVDNVFNNPRAHAMEICAAISGSGLKAHWGCLASPIGLDGELLGAMSVAGCESVEIGADSLSDKALKGLGKPFTAKSVSGSVQECKKAGMPHMLFLILGGPGEDEDTLKETFDELDRLKPDKVFAVAGVRVYPETPIHRLAVEKGVLRPDDSLLEPAFYVSDALGDRLYEIAGDYFRQRPGWIYYRANAILDGRPRPAVSAVEWDSDAESCLNEMLKEIPRLMRPIAKKAVVRKTARTVSEKGAHTVYAADVVDAFMAETPAPFRAAMEKSLRKLGFIA